ncbi:MAG: shikimate dehydrogenase [Pseudomonadales bacterium]|nr:shikimate dehydrogenase [Pseudomonadales bacterium]
MSSDSSIQALDRYAVFGNPIAQSVSPAIHAAFAQQTGQVMRYDKVLVEADEFEAQVRRFFSDGGCGLNITVPFKQRAWAMAERLSTAAAHAGAVNTLYLDDGVLCGDNTDGAGLCRDLQHNLGWPLQASRVLLVGAGGAVRGVIGPLLDFAPASLVIANRDVAKATALAEQFAAQAGAANIELRSCSLAEVGQAFDLVINGTSASLAGAIPAIAGSAVNHARCYDMVYAATPTPFLHWAAQAGGRSLADGLGMLVEQAAAAFTLWRGVQPQTAPVIEQLRATL